MILFGITASIVIVGIVAFIATMSRHGEKLIGDEESSPVIWADENWYKPAWSKDDGPPDG